jgi:hypothetical protein
LNLQLACNNVVFLLRWYNSALERQAWGRVLRFGQTRPVTIHYIRYADCYVDGAWIDRIHDLKARGEEALFSCGEMAETSDDGLGRVNEIQLQALHNDFIELRRRQ